ncbi:MAG: Hsp70 family protein [Propionivibrio sp.]|uniref:Hsp70 family protein n=1 Tax=Candidatus Propionivibrio dominans TaxID=2954373 RepID=A0A9D7IDM6_9RHOO|nr:Hsp70 family protein [Candidatus Propionivibrio dominans]
MSDIIVGIDLGTTNSEIAVVRHGRIEIIDIEAGVPILPSVVGLGDDNVLLVGAAARNQYVLHPERTIRSVKRRMGEATHLALGDKQYSPPEISAMILLRLKKIAETHLGVAVSKAVITVPAYFSDAQRQATREAGEIAGLEVVRILNEPTAAALAYGAHRSTQTSAAEGAPTRKALVYDLGGGTFDVSVVNMEGVVVEVLASHGNNHLGGDDFDQCIVDFVLAHLNTAHGIDSATAAASPIAMARLYRAAEAAKIALSSHPYATLAEEFLYEKNGAPVHLSLEISRHEYETMIEPFIHETMDAMHVALSGAKLALSAIDEVLLVGGATRTPMVARLLEALTGILPHGEIDPDLCVAMGAAIQGEIIAGGTTPTVLIDVTPYTFGTSTVADLGGREYPYCFVPLIRRNTPIPTSHSEVFYTMFDNQEAVEVTVFQGEAPDALDNIEIGRFVVKGLRQVPAGNPIVIDFAIDINGILHVRASEKKSGLEFSITIDNAITRFQDGKLDEARKRISSMFADDFGPDDEADTPEMGAQSAALPLAQRRHLVEALALVEKAERLLKTAGADDREDLIDNIEAVRDAMSDAGENDDAKLLQAMSALADVLYYLEN